MIRRFGAVLLASLLMLLSSAAADSAPTTAKTEQITVGGGCFWCIEAIFQGFKGVEQVEPGYAGGVSESPSYKQVSTGTTGHAEVVRVTFDPAVISLHKLLTVFFHAHDPTTKNRQGADVGTQYRSIILYASDSQRAAAEQVKGEISAATVWEDPIVTEIVPLLRFYPAEEYHRNYYLNNPNQPYCSIVIGPKVQKIRREFSDLVKRPG